MIVIDDVDDNTERFYWL